MKRWLRQIVLLVMLCMLNVSLSEATTLFSANFETDLSDWVGKSGGPHNGQIVTDPVSVANNVLNFTALNGMGDIFSTNTFSSTTSNQFIVEFDYFGTNMNSGGFIGYSYGLPGSHVWLAGSDTDYTDTSIWPNTLIGDNSWHHYSIAFTTAGPVHLMLEDFAGSDQVAGNAYFDNILLTDANGPTPVPEPSTILLLGAGLAGVGLFRKRFKN